MGLISAKQTGIYSFRVQFRHNYIKHKRRESKIRILFFYNKIECTQILSSPVPSCEKITIKNFLSSEKV